MANSFTSVVHTGHSKSLWNHTLSPGWTNEETRVLYLCLQKYGIGNYKKILQNMHLPEKTMAQINNQTQRFLGQQATKEFHLMKVDLDAVNAWNAAKKGKHIQRKNGCIINSGNKLEREDVRKLQESHIERFGLSEEYQRHIVIPTVTGEQTSQLMVEGDDVAEGWLSFRQQKMKRLASMEVALQRLTKQLAMFGATPDHPVKAPAASSSNGSASVTDTVITAESDEPAAPARVELDVAAADEEKNEPTTAASSKPAKKTKGKSSTTTVAKKKAKAPPTKKARAPAKKAKAPTKKKAPAPRAGATKRAKRASKKTQEQLDAELAARLQAQEDEGGWGF
eukprot:INCI10307.1.p1 GENE.INCI10307.1~~INCI10307.1.p1  ORF type:complete len:338 (-),score=72.14 INCI10307.1:190-1203(-)